MTLHPCVDKGRGPERLVQIGVAMNQHERDHDLHEQMLEQYDELLPPRSLELYCVHCNIYDMVLLGT